MQFLLFVGVLASTSFLVNGNQSTYNDGSVTSYYFNRTFLKIIPTTNVSERDTIYWTPPVYFFSKAYNGIILRCLQEAPNVCENFYIARSDILSMVISGQDMYVGRDDGQILICDLYEKSCKIFQNFNSSVFTLTIGGGYLYAGLFNKTIMRCDLLQTGSCHPLHTMETSASCLLMFDRSLYVALPDKLMRCSNAPNSCSLMFIPEIYSYVRTLVNMADRILLTTSDGLVFNCSTSKSDCARNENSPADFDGDIIKHAASFNGNFYAADKHKILVCKWPNRNNCSDYAYHEDNIWTMAFAYGTYEMQRRYKGEDTTCTWQGDDKCPPLVYYYDKLERIPLEVHVTGGRLYNSKGLLVDTTKADEGHEGPAAIFAMGPDGRILLSNAHKKGLLEVSSLFAGKPVAGAGEMVVKAGVIQKMTACSEHYRPDLALNQQVIQSLRHQGYTDPIDSRLCCYNGQCNQNEQ